MKRVKRKIEPMLKELVWRVSLKETEWEIVLRRVDGIGVSSGGLNAIWRKIQPGLLRAFQFGVNEWKSVDLGTKRAYRLDWSARQIHFKEKPQKKVRSRR